MSSVQINSWTLMLICIINSILNIDLTLHNSWVPHISCVSSILGALTWVLTLQIAQLKVDAGAALILIQVHVLGRRFVFPAVAFVTLVRLLRDDVAVVSLASVAVKLIRVWVITLGVLRRMIILVILHGQWMICSNRPCPFPMLFHYGVVVVQTKLQVGFGFDALLRFVRLEAPHAFDIILSANMTITQLTLTIFFFFNLNHVN